MMQDNGSYLIDKEMAGKKLRDFLRDNLRLSHRNLVAYKKAESITVNGEKAFVDMTLREGDVVRLRELEEDSEGILPEEMPLDIVFEDSHLIVINKRPGVPVHPTRKHFMGTLANGLMYYLMDRGKSARIRPVNRLDKDTSGLVIFAKSAHVQHLMSLEEARVHMEKVYLAVVEGQVEKMQGTIDAPIAREQPQRMKRVVRDGGDRAVTHYHVLERSAAYTVLEILIETGRTHQIRVHLAHIGHPLMGDFLYGQESEKINRHALHAYRLSFIHPFTGAHISLMAPIPEDIKGFIKD